MGMGTPGYVLPGTMGPREQQQQQEYVTQFNNAAYAPIPGYNGGVMQPLPTVGTPPSGGMPPSRIPGLPPQPSGPPQMTNHMFRGGPYQQQAMMLAGLLGNPGQGYPSGLLSGKRPYRPGGK